MTPADNREELRRLVRELLQEVLPPGGSVTAPAQGLDGLDRRPAPAGDVDVRRVQVRDDRDLADVVTQVLNLAEDPARAADLRAGRIRFALVAGDPEAPEPGAPGPIEVSRGAVTERLVQRAAREQRPLRLGPGAVVTPLARDRARALGVSIDRSHASDSTHRTQG